MYSRVRDLREDHDMKQREVADYLRCSQQVYSNYELGQRDIPTDILIKLSELYHVSTDYILGLTNNPTQIKPEYLHENRGDCFDGLLFFRL